MKVRVFVPKDLDHSDGSDSDGFDYDFEVLPEVGQFLRFSDTDKPDYKVERVGFIQDDHSFVASVWLARTADASLWLRSMTD